MGFYSNIQQHYGRRTANQLKSWAKINIKLARLRNRRVFLLQCKNQGIKPNHIVDKIKCLQGSISDSVSASEAETMSNKVIHRILLLELKLTVKQIILTERECSKLKKLLEGSLPVFIVGRFMQLQSIHYNREFHRVKALNVRKVVILKDQQLLKLRSQQTWFKNVSNIEIPPSISSFLALGPKFSIEVPKKEVSVKTVLSNVEFILQRKVDLDIESRNVLRALSTNAITNFLHKTPAISNCYQSEFYKCRRFLASNRELLILQSDKGNVTVAMSRSDYDRLSLEILEDKKYYIVLTRDPTLTIQGRANELVKMLKCKNYVDSDVARALFTYNAIPARFYGLPKVHKPELSLRPIISSINTPTSKLSVFVSEILAMSVDNNNRYFVKDSFEFSNFINDFQLPPGYVLVSFDVVSLYSNIPVELALRIIDEGWDAIAPHTSISKEDFLVVLRFIFCSNYFKFKGVIYKQVFGSPMGSNLSPIVARVVMDYVLDRILESVDFEIPFIKKYVDDIICSLPKNQVQNTLRLFNGYNEHIQFTIEEETANAVPFLDTKLIRTPSNKIILDWYRKPTSSGRYMNFFSNHPMKQKINMVLAMRNRISKISHPSLLRKNLLILRNVMVKNSYPVRLLNRLIYGVGLTAVLEPPVDGLGRPPENVSDDRGLEVSTRKFRISFPLIGELTSKLSRILGDEKVRIVAKSSFTLKKLFSNIKDRIPIMDMSGVVYGIPCSGCELVYVGQTSQQLKRRICQHKSDAKILSKKCALALHCRSSDHVIDYEQVKILDIENNYHKRLFLEMAHIKENSSMNAKTDVQGLSAIYSFILGFGAVSGQFADSSSRVV